MNKYLEWIVHNSTCKQFLAYNCFVLNEEKVETLKWPIPTLGLSGFDWVKSQVALIKSQIQEAYLRGIMNRFYKG